MDRTKIIEFCFDHISPIKTLFFDEVRYMSTANDLIIYKIFHLESYLDDVYSDLLDIIFSNFFESLQENELEILMKTKHILKIDDYIKHLGELDISQDLIEKIKQTFLFAIDQTKNYREEIILDFLNELEDEELFSMYSLILKSKQK